MSWLGSLFGGENKTLNQDISATGSLAGFSSSTGQGDTSTASNFYRTLLSGNQASIGKLLAPQISSQQKQGQQKKQALSQFGNRSGGTNAAVQGIGDTTTANINDMISKLTSGAASGLAGLGTNLLNTGLGAYGQQASLSQQKMQNIQGSIFGQGITSGVGYAEGFGLGKV
jgi:hypothetical protein